ncbi:odorant receptor 49b-like [Wyeomyia smithii]|uniref:odorant receptor 49b-like n=1 Tax=Wyeomyia smithii TaxID=174621 RepID=UPI002467AFA2|nr:odorant receptor 49b-like [Wyeomyia smithii]
MVSARKPSEASQHKVLAVGLKLLHLVGLWGEDRRKWYRVVVFCLSFIIIPPKMFLGSGKDTYDSYVRNVAELIFTCENDAWMVIFTYRQDSFRKLVEILECFFNRDWPDELRNQIETLNRWMYMVAKFYVIYVGVLVVLFVNVPIVATVAGLIFNTKAEMDEFFLITETQFYGLDIRRDLLSWAIFTSFSTIVSCSGGFVMMLKGVIAQIIIHYGAKLFELVSKRIKLMEQIVDSDQRDCEFRKIIELHNLSLEYLRYLEHTLSFSLLNITLSCLMMWCLMLFYISKNFNGVSGVCFLIPFVALLGEMTVYSINGTNLQKQASAVADAICEYPWYREPVAMQKAVGFMIQRAQQPAGITAGKFHYIDLQRLGAMLQATYSYYLILKDRF